jgi:membrane protease YdiL (CAAX protease family)
MTTAHSNTEQSELRLLDKRWLVGLIYLISLGLLLHGALHINNHYGSAPFVVRFWTTELQVAILLIVSTLAFFPAARIGLRPIQWGNARQALPILILTGTAMVVWCIARFSQPAYVATDNILSLQILRTTLLVGLSEEWMYRGLLLVVLIRWFGTRRGALLSLLLFGVLHLLNLVAGVSVVYSIAQFFITMLIGASLLLAAFATRSLLIPMLAHAIYDFCVVDIGQLLHADSGPWAILTIFGTGLLCGGYSLYCIVRLPDSEPFVD